VQLTSTWFSARWPVSPMRMPSSSPRRISWRPREVDPGVVIVLIVYFVGYSFLIMRGDGIPYVMDNNETFSALNHAHNLWTFDFFRSFGLTDEAVSPDPAAHPFVHTHQGNFPRLLAFLLYALGARSVESHVWITTLTVGTASVLMGYIFFRRLGGKLLATIAILLLMTDYLMFAQWQVNTYRVWQGFLLFAALNSVHGLSEWGRWRWALATTSTYAALFYGELVFAAFVSFTVGLYTIWTYRRAPRLVVMGGLVQGAGASLGLGALILQLVLHLGWQDFLTDLQLTLTARNYAPDRAELIAKLTQFYGPRNILFLYNIQPEERFLGFIASLRLLFRFMLQTPTPLLSLLGVGMAAASLFADSRRPGPRDVTAILPGVSASSVAVLVPGLFVFLMSIAAGNAVVGLPFSGLVEVKKVILIALACMLLAIALAVLLRICTRSISISGAPPGVSRCVRASLFLFCFGLMIMVQSELYDQEAAILWWQRLTPFPIWIAKVIVCGIAFTGCILILTGRRAILGRWHDVPSSLFPFFASGALAYMVVYKLSSGYVFTGYLNRLCPFLIFHVDALIALGLFTAITIPLTLIGRTDFNRLLTKAVATVSTLVALAFVGGWIFVQIRSMQLFPPDRLAFVRHLNDPDFRGRGLISNTYAAPFSYFANAWGYTETNPLALGTASLSSQSTSYRIFQIWLADRLTNPAYLRPALYVCFNALSSMQALIWETARSGVPCSHRVPSNATILARDSEHDRWAILRLEWTSSDR
jgi:hypothetical protein